MHLAIGSRLREKTSTPKYPQDLSAHIMQVCEQYK